MTRPEIIRADSIDLQHHAAVPEQAHHKPSANGLLAPHQAETIREVAAETAQDRRLSWVGGDIGDLEQYADEGTVGAQNTMQAGKHGSVAAQESSANGQESGEGGMDGEADGDVDDEMMDKISSSPSIEDEDIDFEFVYALHTFVATVEGQANATKGDTMVLLDDTNSYWWLVRVVKDSSIGYLPAEHIETPTERLARLNKHRNIDLSATMLGDQAEKARNPLMSAMKRRKTKTVQFAAPTYVDYSDFDYSSEEEDMEAEYFAHPAHQQAQQAASQQVTVESDIEDETAKVEPLRPRSQASDTADDKGADGVEGDKVGRPSNEDVSDSKPGDGPKKSSDGTVRDSFFKDDTVETKKITLTPNLLRDDASIRSASSDSKELRQRPSLDRPDKEGPASKDDRKKKDKKEKDKKAGGLRSLFSRKDKKTKGEEDDESGRKSTEGDFRRDGDSDEPQSSPEKSPQRASSKLQKQKPRVEPSPTRKSGTNDGSSSDEGMDLATFLSEGKVNNITTAPPAAMRIVEPGAKETREADAARIRSPEASRKKQDLTSASKGTASQTRTESSPPSATNKPKSRLEVELAQMGSEEDLSLEPTTQSSLPRNDMATAGPLRQRPNPGPSPLNAQVSQAQALQSSTTTQTNRAMLDTALRVQSREMLTDSPLPISPDNVNNPPPLMVDTSSQEEDQSSRSTPSPHLTEHDDDGDMGNNKDSVTTSTSTGSTTVWNDASLRAFFDSGTEIRDLLAVVYDKTDVVPAGSEHPVVGSLFKEQNAKLAEITTQLDNMLGDWLARKQRLRGAV